MGIRILRLQVWQRSCRGSRWTMRTATQGTRTGSCSFFQICLWYMFICQFFSGNPNFGVTRVTNSILRVQVNNEDGNPRDQDRELLIFSKMYMIHVYMLIFQWESKFWGHKGDKFHIEGPGEQWEWQPQGPGQGVIHFFQPYMWYMFICQFFNENPNFWITMVTKEILRVQVNKENGNPRDQDRE